MAKVYHKHKQKSINIYRHRYFR